MTPQLRIARPVKNIARSRDMYCRGLGLQVLGSFEDHDGFDGVMLGLPGAMYHFEFTHQARHLIVPTPTPEDLVVFYLPDATAWRSGCAAMLEAGFVVVTSNNPYWDKRGQTFADLDGYRIVLECSDWRSGDAVQQFV